MCQTLCRYPVTTLCSSPTAYRMLVQHDLTRYHTAVNKWSCWVCSHLDLYVISTSPYNHSEWWKFCAGGRGRAFLLALQRGNEIHSSGTSLPEAVLPWGVTDGEWRGRTQPWKAQAWLQRRQPRASLQLPASAAPFQPHAVWSWRLSVREPGVSWTHGIGHRDVRESRICPCLSSDAQQRPLSVQVCIQDAEALFGRRGTTQPRSDGTVETPNRTDYLWRLRPNWSCTFNFFVTGHNLSYHLGDLGVSFILVICGAWPHPLVWKDRRY